MGRMLDVLRRHRAAQLAVLAVLALAVATVDLNGAVNRGLLRGPDERAKAYLDDTMRQALVAFGVSKAFNAVISLIQGTTVSVAPVGVGLTLSVGEVLDPMNDLVERASWVFLAATVSVGLQQTLLAVARSVDLNLVAWAVLGLAAVSLLAGRGAPFWRSAGIKLLLVCLLARASVPVCCLASQWFTDDYLAGYAQGLAGLSQDQAELAGLQQSIDRITGAQAGAAPDGDCPFYDLRCQTRGVTDRLAELRDVVTKKFQRIQEMIGNATEKFINLITLFVIQVVVLPLAWLWLMVAAVRWVLGRRSLGSVPEAWRDRILGPRA